MSRQRVTIRTKVAIVGLLRDLPVAGPEFTKPAVKPPDSSVGI